MFSSKGSLRHFEVLEHQLDIDEKVLFCFLCASSVVGSTPHIFDIACAFTDKRLILARHNKRSSDLVYTYTLEDINNVATTKGSLTSNIIFDSLDVKINLSLSTRDFNTVIENLSEIIPSKRNPVTNIGTIMNQEPWLHLEKCLIFASKGTPICQKQLPETLDTLSLWRHN